ncbi:ABC transporter substrate-binding protein [Curtobacterium sp. PhB136]|uniref:ABC transporter substrate-binding protein n=1 Tax=Curtobacterium sp. PhB136 TaxID=2485181 RepID=UPI00104561CA|nr:ABC transporter substrate-binding protein [Curtobacterium sp. PhB136]TCK59244.1 raffinose/stachyose/melibiose transport system substrate-binding protein [Curtobacterium sp. PhB136]
MSTKTTIRGIAAISMATALVALGLTGCSSGSSAADSNTLTVATNGQNKAINAVKGAFEKANPGVNVVVKDYSQNYRTVIGAQLTAGNAPDLLAVPAGGGNNISARGAGDKGYYANLNDQSWAKDVSDTQKEQLSNSKGQLMAVPVTLSSIGGVYNHGAVEAAGLTVPTTWDGVLDFCRGAKAKGNVAYGLGLSDTWTDQLIPYALTASLVYGPDPDFTAKQDAGKATFSDSAWKKALNMYMQMEQAGCFNSSPNGTPYSSVQDAIRKGTTLATVTVSSETAAIKAGGPSDLTLDYAAFPATNTPSDTYLGTSSLGFGINAKTNNKALAEKFLTYLATPKAQIGFSNTWGDAAAMPGTTKQDSQVNKVVQQFVTEDKTTTWPDRNWPTAALGAELPTGIQALFSGTGTVKDMLAKLDDLYTQGS